MAYYVAMRSLEPLWPGWTLPESFFEALPDEMLADFEDNSPRYP